MGILDSLTKNPGLLGLAALGIGLFIFRDRISGFFSDITGGAAGTAKVAEVGGILAENLTSNLTFTPRPDDPIFGESGLFAGIAKGISEFKFPSFELPSLPSFPEPEGTGGDFTDVGMAGARSDRGITAEVRAPIFRIPDSSIFAELEPRVSLTEFPSTIIEETQAQFQERSGAFAEAFPEITAFTSIGEPALIQGSQLSRNQQDFQSILDAEARRSEAIFANLFGNVQNPDF